MKPYLLHLLIFLGIGANKLDGQGFYLVDPQYPVHPIDNALLVLKDSSRTLTIDQLLSDTSLIFSPFTAFDQRLDRQAIYWAKIQLAITESIEAWYLHFEDRNYGNGGWGRGNGKVDVYAYQNAQLIWHKKRGSR